jgi:hypothetical protein
VPINIAEPERRRIILNFNGNGTVVYRLEAFYSGSLDIRERDTGSWTVQDGQLCMQWSRKGGGQTTCYQVLRNSDTLWTLSGGHRDFVGEYFVR